MALAASFGWTKQNKAENVLSFIFFGSVRFKSRDCFPAVRVNNLISLSLRINAWGNLSFFDQKDYFSIHEKLFCKKLYEI